MAASGARSQRRRIHTPGREKIYTEDDLQSAVQAGVLSADAADALRGHAVSRRATPFVDEEHFRLITGFNDIFVVIACLLLLVSVAWIGSAALPGVGHLGMAASAWLLAEFFVRKRHMALPAIVLLVAFVAGLVMAVLSLEAAAEPNTLYLAAASVLGAVGAWLHWLRFRVPITVTAGLAAGVCAVWALLFRALPVLAYWLPLVVWVSGVLVFAVALRWDASDTLRRTRRADVAFWLHLLAAPLLVHPVFISLVSSQHDVAAWQAALVLLVYAVIAIVSLVLDRRALMVSALGYVLYTFGSLLKQHGNVSLGFSITALVIGAVLLLLSAFWHPARAALLRQLPVRMHRYIAPLQ
jgi:hypothetical protein